MQDIYEYVFRQSDIMDHFGIFSSFPRKLVSPDPFVSELQGVLTVEKGEGFDPITLVSNYVACIGTSHFY